MTFAVSLLTFVQVLKAQPGLEVHVDAGNGKGKGFFSQKVSIKQVNTSQMTSFDHLFLQDLVVHQNILNEAPLVAGQHVVNKRLALVCSHCFKFLGGIELQLAWCKWASMCEGKTSLSNHDHPHCCAHTDTPLCCMRCHGLTGTALSGVVTQTSVRWQTCTYDN